MNARQLLSGSFHQHRSIEESASKAEPPAVHCEKCGSTSVSPKNGVCGNCWHRQGTGRAA